MSQEIVDLLLLDAGPFRAAVRLEDVLEVADMAPVHPVPRTAPALRGVSVLRERLVPVVHLGALLGNRPCPEAPGSTLVLTGVAQRTLGLEVTAADVAVREAVLPVPPGEWMPWATGMFKRDDRFIPILNPQALLERLTETETSL